MPFLWIVLGLMVIGLAVAALWQGLTVKKYRVPAKQLTGPVTLALLTDLHSTRYGKGQKTLLRRLESLSPDLVLLAGDIVDDLAPQTAALELLDAIGKKYPCFYASGNHEFRSGHLEEIKELFRERGIAVLAGSTARAEIRGQQLLIAGVDDPEGYGAKRNETYEAPAGWKRQLEECRKEQKEELFSVLVSHRPELWSEYRSSGFDLTVTGHAHGGQVRVPGLLNGLFAPGQGLFPRYAGGLYPLGSCTLIVGRGLCRNALPRVFNPPELVSIVLEPVEQESSPLREKSEH